MLQFVRDVKRRMPLIVATASIAFACGLRLMSGWAEGAATTQSSSSSSQSKFKKAALELLNELDLLQGIERAAYDWRVSFAARFAPPASTQLGFIYIDDRTIQDLGSAETLEVPFGLLWPRYVYGRLLRELHAQGAKAVGFDVFTSDARLDHAALAIGGTNVVDSDIFFLDQIRAATNTTVILASLSNSVPAIVFRQGPIHLGDAFSPRDPDGVARRIRTFQNYVMPSKALEIFAYNNDKRIVRFTPEVVLESYDAASHSFVLSTNTPGPDGWTEFISETGAHRLIQPVETQRVWHLGIVLAAQVLGWDLSKAVVEPGRIIFTGTDASQRIVPIDRSGRMYVDWTVRVRKKQLLEEAFERVLEGDVIRQHGNVADVRTNWFGKCVVVGSVATGNNMTDIGPTPLGKAEFLVGTYLNLANSIIQQRFVHRWGVGGELVLILLLGAVGIIINARLTPERATAAAICAVVVYLAIACFAFVERRLWLPVAHPVGGGLLLTHASLLTYRAFFEQRERQRVKAVFSRLVSPDVVQELLRQERFTLGGARRQITVFFADVRGFTEMTDRRQAAAEEYVQAHGLIGEVAESYYEREAHEVLDTVNRYLAAIAEVIKQRSGTLDKYIGDCVMAFWGAPTPNPRHAVDAVLAAIDAQRAIDRLNTERENQNRARMEENRERAARGLPLLPAIEQLSLGTGVNTGTMMVGLMGSEAHTFNYTVFGREVNLASRLEGVSGRARIIIGEATYNELVRLAPELAAMCVMRESVQVKGFRDAANIYEVLWRLEAAEKTVNLRVPAQPSPR